ncbi:MAG: PqqD family protein [Oscillospiraceae bacterium]|jgi:hypothetical protein|nr:PqqD family protein [Oscillospiraceae bacterium]
MAYKLTYLERRSGFVVRKVGEAHMVVPTGARMKEYRGMITINETGAFLFEQIKTRRSTQELVDALIAEYGIDDKTALEAIESFVDQCSFANLLVSEEVEELPIDKQMYIRDDIREQVEKERAEKLEQKKREDQEKLKELNDRVLLAYGKTLQEYVEEKKAAGEVEPDGSIRIELPPDPKEVSEAEASEKTDG